MFKEILLNLKFIEDKPEEDEIQFGFKEYAESIARFLTNDDIPTPFVIAINGEWGSGKTTLLKCIKEKIYAKNELQKMIEFSAWEYERIDLFAALLHQISEKFNKKNNGKQNIEIKKIEKTLAIFALDVFLRRTVNMTAKDAKEYFTNTVMEIPTLKNKLQKIVTEKLVIFIDDLDRCNVENVLLMLENLKIFLTIKNIIIIIALDMEKIEKAWELQYNNNKAKMIGRDHTEKMFQLKLQVPYKHEDELEEFVNKIANSLKSEYIEFLVKILPHNPRKIKLALNLMYFILKNEHDHSPNEIINEKYYIYSLIMWIGITNSHRDVAKIAKKTSSNLIYAAFACHRLKSRAHLGKNLPTPIQNSSTIDKIDDGYTIIAKNSMNVQILEILKIAADDQDVFEILKCYGHVIDPNKRTSTYTYVAEEYYENFKPFPEFLDQIIKNVPT